MNLTEALTDLLASPGPHLIAIDGPAGSGKSTLAKDLYLYYSATRDVNLLGLDDIYDGWDNALGQKLTNDLEKMAQAHANKTSFSVPIYNWATSSYGEVRVVEAREILIIEGVGSAQEIIRSHKAITIWMDIDPEHGVQRVLERDGHHIAEQMKAWQIMQSQHFAESGARDNADFIITAQ
ncbi:udk, uridine kinase [Candidatus Nanopelagicaceae bacterium]